MELELDFALSLQNRLGVKDYLRSRNGHTIRFLDSTPEQGNQGALVIEDAHGNRITMTNGKIKIQGKPLIEIEAEAIVLQGPNSSYRRIVSPITSPI